MVRYFCLQKFLHAHTQVDFKWLDTLTNLCTSLWLLFVLDKIQTITIIVPCGFPYILDNSKINVAFGGVMNLAGQSRQPISHLLSCWISVSFSFQMHYRTDESTTCGKDYSESPVMEIYCCFIILI